MSRTLSAAEKTLLAAWGTQPATLVQLLFPSPTNTLRYSDAGDITQGGDLFVGGMKMDKLTWGKGPGFTTSMALNNGDGALSAIFMTHGWHDHVVKIYAYYPGLDSGRKIKLCEGEMDGGGYTPRTCTLGVRLRAGDKGKLPRITMGPPVFNWVPEPGQKFAWGSQTFEMEN